MLYVSDKTLYSIRSGILSQWSFLRTGVMSQSALELDPSHCPNGRLGQDLGFGGFAFALKLPELLNTNLPSVF